MAFDETRVKRGQPGNPGQFAPKPGLVGDAQRDRVAAHAALLDAAAALDLTAVPGTPVLVGIGGSHAYGLAHADSDIDYRGCYLVPTQDLFRLTSPPESFTRTDPDVAMHEVGKFVRLATSANPTVLEVLHYDTYVASTPVGDLLVENRHLFLSEQVRVTHVGYARSQFKRLQNREGTFSADTAKRTAKHARHLLRLVRQGHRAITTGELSIRVTDRDELFAFGNLPYEQMCAQAEAEIAALDAAPSVLPPQPDGAAIDRLLIAVREANLGPPR